MVYGGNISRVCTVSIYNKPWIPTINHILYLLFLYTTDERNHLVFVLCLLAYYYKPSTTRHHPSCHNIYDFIFWSLILVHLKKWGT